ncbi:MAG: hypothetical protein HGA62_10390 [Chlorobiaceae bacterium]|nr:hypothetical protein [Chlorobiaceae bacterium]NTV61527.1 hypothetical protein [Chlorobiaceae bacterium]
MVPAATHKTIGDTVCACMPCCRRYSRPLRTALVRLPLLLIFLFSQVQPVLGGEFEGLYQVGKTRCNVKPVKMAYEVKWAKGHGSMFFFFSRKTPEGKYLFVSESFRHKVDTFLFDDSLLTRGKFIRSDGKVFSLGKTGK